MRRLLMFSFLILLVGVLSAAQADASLMGANITIPDGITNTVPSGGGAVGPGHEDNEVVSGAQQGQKWDLEGFFFKPGNKLSMVGGWNFQNGVTSGTHYFSGDIFIDTNGVVNFGSPGSTSTSNSYYGYEYAIKVSWAAGTWEAYKLTGDSVVTIVSDFQSSNPLSLTLTGHETPKASGNFSQNLLTDAELTETGFLNWPGYLGTHYKVTGFDLSFLGNTDFLAHFTFSCGNDSMAGRGHVVPIPGSLLLLGSGLVGLLGISRRRNKK